MEKMGRRVRRTAPEAATGEGRRRWRLWRLRSGGDKLRSGEEKGGNPSGLGGSRLPPYSLKRASIWAGPGSRLSLNVIVSADATF